MKRWLDSNYSRIIVGMCLVSFSILLYVVIFQLPSDRAVYDERNFVSNLRLLQEKGFTSEFLRGIEKQSPGPLYQVVHILLSPITGLKLLAMRLANFSLLAATIFIIWRYLVQLGARESFPIAISILTLPMSWLVGGLALTEIPTMIFTAASIYCLIVAIKESSISLKIRNLYASLGGIFLGIAITGRSPMLVALPAGLIFFRIKNRKVLYTLLIFFLSAMPLPALLFYIWRGVVPPLSQGYQSGFAPMYGIYAGAYAGLAIAIIAPSFLMIKKRQMRFFVFAFPFIFLTNHCIWKIQFMPASTTISNIIGESLMPTYSSICATFAILVTILFLVSLINNLLQNWNNHVFFFASLTFTGLLLSCITSSAQFSYRYVFQGMPFLIIMLADYFRFDRLIWLRMLIGIALGYKSLSPFL